jgi:hypothetical protein
MATLYWGPTAGTSTGTWSGASITNWFTDAGRITPSLSAPTSVDDVVFDAASDNGSNFTVTLGTDAVCRNLTANNLDFTMTLSFASNGLSVYGSLFFPATRFTKSGFGPLSFRSTSLGNTITTNTVNTELYNITFNGVGGSWILQNNINTVSASVELTNGTLDLNGNTLTTYQFLSNNSNTRAINFNGGKIVLTGTGANIWVVSTATNFTCTGTPTVEANNATAGNRNFFHGTTAGATEANSPNFFILAGAGAISLGNAKTVDFTGFSGTLDNTVRTIYGNLIISTGMTVGAGTNLTTFAATSGTQQITTNGKTLNFPLTFDGIGGVCAFQDALTQGSTRAFTVTNGTVQLKNGVTSTVGSFATSGTNQKFLQSTLAGSQATLSQASGTINASYLTIQDINATGGAAWNARTDLGSKDITNNTGWNFLFIAIQQILKPIMAKILQPIILN